MKARMLMVQRMIRWEMNLTVQLREVTPKKCRQMEVKKIQQMRSKKQWMMVFQWKTKTINLLKEEANLFPSKIIVVH